MLWTMESQDRHRSALVVDDDDFVRNFVCEALETWGFEVYAAEDGKTAAAILAEHHDISLIVTDILMPSGDGIGLILKVRGDAGNAQPKIIAISGGGVIQADLYLQNARGLGADASLSKPFSSHELMRTVARLGFGGPWPQAV
jgi:CheY-like chemotaxis protein